MTAMHGVEDLPVQALPESFQGDPAPTCETPCRIVDLQQEILDQIFAHIITPNIWNGEMPPSVEEQNQIKAGKSRTLSDSLPPLINAPASAPNLDLRPPSKRTPMVEYRDPLAVWHRHPYEEYYIPSIRMKREKEEDLCKLMESKIVIVNITTILSTCRRFRETGYELYYKSNITYVNAECRLPGSVDNHLGASNNPIHPRPPISVMHLFTGRIRQLNGPDIRLPGPMSMVKKVQFDLGGAIPSLSNLAKVRAGVWLHPPKIFSSAR